MGNLYTIFTQNFVVVIGQLKKSGMGYELIHNYKFIKKSRYRPPPSPFFFFLN